MPAYLEHAEYQNRAAAATEQLRHTSHADCFRRNAPSWQLASNTCRRSTQLSGTTTDPHPSLNFPVTFFNRTRALLSPLIASGYKTRLGFAPTVKHYIKNFATYFNCHPCRVVYVAVCVFIVAANRWRIWSPQRALIPTTLIGTKNAA